MLDFVLQNNSGNELVEADRGLRFFVDVKSEIDENNDSALSMIS